MVGLLELSDGPETGSGNGVFVARQQLFHVQEPRDLLQNQLGVLRDRVDRDGRRGHGGDALAESLDHGGSVVVVGEGILRIVVVLEQVQEELEHFRRTDAMGVAQAGHGDRDLFL